MKLTNIICKYLGMSLSLSLAVADVQADYSTEAIESFTITEQEVSGDCDTQYADFAPAEAMFRQAVCHYHQDISVEGVDSNIERLRDAQTQGLAASKQSLAALLEGLSHCQQARNVNISNTSTPLEASQFCDSRSNSLASLSSINWRYARFAYDPATQLDASILLSSLSSCYDQYDGPLNTQFDVTCAISSDLTQQQKQNEIQDTFEAVKSRYFGGTSPITQMFAEKRNIAMQTKAGSEAKRDILQNRADGVLAAYMSVRDPFYTNIKNPDNPNSPLDIVVGNYKNAYSLGTAILNKLSDWEKGLLVQKKSDGTEIDHSGILDEKYADLNTRIGGINSTLGPIDKITKISQVISDVEARQSNAEASAKQLCKVYYCNLNVAPPNPSAAEYTSACQSEELFDRQKNPLCENVGTKLVIGNVSWTAREFCNNYNFNETAECFN